MPTKHKKNVVAHPPPTCDHCYDPLKCGPFYMDVRIPFYENKWGWLCFSCTKIALLGPLKLGTGLGQKYDSRTDIKLEG